MTGFRKSALVFVFALFSFPAAAQVVSLPGGSGETAVFDSSNNLIVVTRTVPGGYMQLFPAFDGGYRDPVVVVEGFDPLNQKLPSDVYAQINPRGGLDTARAAGRSVWIVNFGDGGGALSANANLVSSAVAQAANYGGLTNAKVDVLGVSMGGVISRYALAYDEQHGGPSDGLVRVFVSGDSPQQGANGSPHFQELILFQNDPATLPTIRCDASLSMLYKSVRSYSTNGCLLGALPSNTNYTVSTAAHDWFYARLNSLNGDGYPHKCRSVAVSNGTWSPLPYAEGSPLFDCRTYATWPWRFQVCSQRYYASAADVAPGSLAGDFAPGNIRQPDFELDQFFVPCFVPTESALDYRGGASKFDRTLIQTANVNHSTVSQETTDFLLEELLGPGWRVNPRTMPDGALANIRGAVVAAVFDGVFYIEQPDRAWGIAVAGSASVAEGDIVNVLGPMGSAAGERRILASETVVAGQQGEVPRPLGILCRSVGGGPAGLYTPGVAGGTGANNTGLLVKCAGRVTGIAPDNTFFCIDDGSGAADDSGFAGIRVAAVGLKGGGTIQPPQVGAVVSVTGVSSAYSSGSSAKPLLRPRRQSDVLTMN